MKLDATTLSLIFVVFSAIISLVIWAIRLEGKTDNASDMVKENSKRDEEDRLRLTKLEDKHDALDKEVSNNATKMSGIEKNIDQSLTSINEKVDILLKKQGLG